MKENIILLGGFASIVLLVVFVLFFFFSGDRYSEVGVRGLPEGLINTEKEAVEFAKGNRDMRGFINGVGSEGDVGFSAHYNDELEVWQAVAYDKTARDIDYQISFTPDGNMTFKGPIPL